MTAAVATSVHAEPHDDAGVVSSLRAGDDFAVLELGDRWSWGCCCDGGCVGYVPTMTLAYP